MSSNRAYEGGWTLVAMNDPAGRRGIWYKWADDTLEVCAGRGGDDDYVRVAAGDTVTPRLLHCLVGVMQTGAWAVQLAADQKDPAGVAVYRQTSAEVLESVARDLAEMAKRLRLAT